MSVSSISVATAYVPPQPSQSAPPPAPPPSTKVDSDGDHDGTKAGSSHLLDVKA